VKHAYVSPAPAVPSAWAESPGLTLRSAADAGGEDSLAAWWNDLVHPYFYLGISIGTCIVVGYLASLFFPAPTRSLAGLTIFKDDDPVISDGSARRSTLSS